MRRPTRTCSHGRRLLVAGRAAPIAPPARRSRGACATARPRACRSVPVGRPPAPHASSPAAAQPACAVCCAGPGSAACGSADRPVARYLGRAFGPRRPRLARSRRAGAALCAAQPCSPRQPRLHARAGRHMPAALTPVLRRSPPESLRRTRLRACAPWPRPLRTTWLGTPRPA